MDERAEASPSGGTSRSRGTIGSAARVMPRPSRLSHPLSAAALSTVWPGLGQWASGRRGRGLLLLTMPLLLAVVAIVLLVSRERADLVGMLVERRVLWAIVAVNGFLLAWRLFSVVDAYGGSGWGREDAGAAGSLVAGAFVVLVALTVVPHLVVGSMALQTLDVINTVFQPEPQPPPLSETPLPTLPPTVLSAEVTTPVVEIAPPTTRVTPRTTVAGTFTAGVEPVVSEPEPSVSLPPQGTPLEQQIDRMTILLAGADAGGARRGFRTDSIMVASMDMKTSQAVLFGIPRNMSWVPLPTWLEDHFDEECKCFPEQINHLYVRTKEWRNTFRDEVDPGMAALREVLEHVMGIRIDHYVLVDMRGFVSLVDALGGVTVDVAAPLWDRVSPIREGDEWIEVSVSPGRRHLDGYEALAYVRSRYGSTDYNRMARQRCVLSAMATEADPLRLFTNFSRFADIIKDNTTTDINAGLLPDLARVATRLEPENIATIGFVPNYYVLKWEDGRWAPDVEKIQHTVRKMMGGDFSSQLVTGLGESECGR